MENNQGNNYLTQTDLDEMVTDDNRQMLKAFIPYLPFRGQQFLSVYTKASELINTLSLFSDSCKDMEICSSDVSDPLEMLEEIRPFTYGQSRQKLDQVTNMLAMLQILKTMNE